MQYSPQNGRYSFIFHHHTCWYNCPYNPDLNPLPYYSHFTPPYVSLHYPYSSHQDSLPIYPSHFFSPNFYIQPPQRSPPKILSATSTIQPIQATSKAYWASKSCVDLNVLTSPCFRKAWVGITACNHWFLIAHT